MVYVQGHRDAARIKPYSLGRPNSIGRLQQDALRPAIAGKVRNVDSDWPLTISILVAVCHGLTSYDVT